MTSKFWVGDRHVDLSRNQITHNEKALTMAPKALSVLTMLAKNQGSVITQDKILDEVWKETVVSPNTLQRSIAQLRKAFGDDAKQQSVIKTHAKKGYSLELEVKWHEQSEITDNSTSPVAHQPSPKQNTVNTFGNPLFAAFALATALIIVGAWTLTPFQTDKNFQITAIRAMTATDNKEFDANYSADGDYFVFMRYHQQICKNRIWAKHIPTQKETLLTPDWGNYSNVSMSPDGKKMVFIEKQDCQPTVKLDPCIYLKQLDFKQAINGSSEISTLMTCSNAQIANPAWISDEELVLMHNPGSQWQLIKYGVKEDSSEILYQPKDGDLVTYDYSSSLSRLAVVRLNDANEPFLDILTTEGKQLSSHGVSEHENIAKGRLIYPKFIPDQHLLLFSTGKQLFSLSYDGMIERITLPLDEGMSTPTFNQDGTQALATKGKYDSDIGTINMASLSQSSSPAQFSNIARTNRAEDDGIFHPQGDLVAFYSARSGTAQIWLQSDDDLIQLTDFPLDSRIRGFRWAQDGQSLLVNNDGLLNQVYTNGTMNPVKANLNVTRLFQWDSNNSLALANVRIKGLEVLARIDLNSGDYIKLHDAPVVWAAKTPSGHLVYLDHNHQFWRSTAAENVLIRDLGEQGSEGRFVLEGEVIYGINNQQQLWTFDLQTRTFNQLLQLPANIDYITDIHNDKLLLSYVVAAKKEIVELTVDY